MSGPVSGPGQPRGPAHEHEFEAAPGLPEALPAGERLLWQGSPQWRALARHAFHVPMLALYFGALLIWRALDLAWQGHGLAGTLQGLLVVLPLPLAALGILGLLAWLSARTTVYTVTDRRVVMRLGIVLSVTFNLPYRQVDTARLKLHRDGTGDLTLALSGSDRIAYLHLWPHARPWHVRRTEPSLRCVAEPAEVGRIVAGALCASAGLAETVNPDAAWRPPAVPARLAGSSPEPA